jgi:hypothetical protein
MVASATHSAARLAFIEQDGIGISATARTQVPKG